MQLLEATIGIVTALDKEFVAACEMLGPVTDVPGSGRTEGHIYSLARVTSNLGGGNVVAITLLPEMGNNAAAAVASHLLTDCPNIKYVVMCGIAGAIPHPSKADDHVRLGDIVVSDRHGVVQHDLQKIENGKPTYRTAPRPPSAALLTTVRRLLGRTLVEQYPWEALIDSFKERYRIWDRPEEAADRLADWMDDVDGVPHPTDPKRRAGKPRIFLGPIASGNTLLKDHTLRDQIRETFGARAVEMEGSGVADACWSLGVEYLIVRGTCDYCNSGKSDAWQQYAALIAAAFTRVIIEHTPALRGSVIPVPLRRDGLAADEGPLGALASAYNILEPTANEPEPARTQLVIEEEAGEETVGGSLATLSLQIALETLRDFYRDLEFEKAFSAADRLSDDLAKYRDYVNRSLVRQCYTILSEVEVTRLKKTASGSELNTERAREYLRLAKEYFYE